MIRLPVLSRFSVRYAVKRFQSEFNASGIRTKFGLKLQIRTATATDTTFIDSLLRDTMNDYVKKTWANNRDKVEEYFRQNGLSEAPKTTFIVYTLDNEDTSRDVGRLSLSIDYQNLLGKFVHIENIHIDEDNQSSGIGREIVRFINNYFAQVLNLTGTSLKVLETNHRARELYENIGFDSIRLVDLECPRTEGRDIMIWKPTYIYQPDRAFYLNKFNPILDKIRDNTIIFSIFFLFFYSMSHIKDRVLAEESVTNSADCLSGSCSALFHTLGLVDSILIFILMFILAVAFTFYDIVAGIFYVQFRPSERLSGAKSWRMDATPKISRISFLLFLEFAMISINIVIVMAPFFFLQTDFRFDGFWMFLLFCLWHSVNFLWYWVSPVLLRECSLIGSENERSAPKIWNENTDQIRWRDFARHGSYALGHLALLILFLLLSPSADKAASSETAKFWQEWITVACLFSYVFLLYFKQVSRYFRNDFQRISRKRGRVRRNLRTSADSDHG